MITVTASRILRAYPIMPALTIWQCIIKRFGRLDKEPKTKLFHYDLLLEVETPIGILHGDILLLRKGIKVTVTSLDKTIIKAFTYNKTEALNDGELNGQGVVVARMKKESDGLF